MGAFPPTRYSIVKATSSASPEVRERAFDTLIAVYWKPVYKYVRVKWSASHEDAKDLTQEFFTAAFEKDFFHSFDAGKGRFRTYLRTCVDGMTANARKASGRIKRGGNAPMLSLDFDVAESELRNMAISSTADPEEFFEREWLRNLFALAVEDLRTECIASGKVAHFALFERYDLDPPDEGRPTYGQLSAEFGIPTTQVTNFLAFARGRFRHHVLKRLENVSGSDEEFRAEAHRLFGAAQR
jgi:RNA polymerase sigma factor (sigma-70 family)